MVITPEQLAIRKTGIGSSDAKRIVDGDWGSLWREKTGRSEWKPTIQQRFAMDCGTALEPVLLNRTAFRFQGTMEDLDTKIQDKGGVKLISHADGWLNSPELYIGVEAKAHGGMKDIDELVEFYMPQLQHHMIVHDRENWMLAVVFGQFWTFDYELVTKDHDWCEQYTDLCREFWSFVESDFEPLDENVKTGAKQIVAKKAVDFTGNNEWAHFADEFINNEASAKLFDTAKSELRKLMPEDAAYAWGHGMQIKRAKNGNLLIKPEVEKDVEMVDKFEEVVKHNEV